MKKTNAARILERLGVPFELWSYEVDPDNVGAEAVAKKVGLPPERVFKTLVARGDKTGIVMACVPGNAELDLKALASASGNKKVELVHVKEIRTLTGYIRGGVSPLGTKKRYPVYMDEKALQYEAICVSAGERGLQLYLSPKGLAEAAGAKFASISRN